MMDMYDEPFDQGMGMPQHMAMPSVPPVPVEQPFGLLREEVPPPPSDGPLLALAAQLLSEFDHWHTYVIKKR